MKHIIILGDGMADHHVERLQGKTPLQYADTPHMDSLAAQGQCGTLVTVPEGMHPGSEIANASILGYDMTKLYEGRGPLEAASIGYEMQPDDLAMRCNIITVADGRIANHHGGHLTTDEGAELIRYLDSHLGSDRVRFIPGIQYRHLLIIKGGNKHLNFAPPHDNPGALCADHLVEATPDPGSDTELTARETAALLNDLIARSQQLLATHPLNIERQKTGKPAANSIWPWGAGYKPDMTPLTETYPQIRSGAVISAVDLIKGIGHYAGFGNIEVEGATGQYDTNYEGKAAAAIEALKTRDFVFLHIEASDEAGHDGDLQLKVKTIENLDSKIVGPIIRAVKTSGEDVCVALMPDHPTPVEMRTHVSEPVPFAIWYPGIDPDPVSTFDEDSCSRGALGQLVLGEFIQLFMKI